MKTFATASFRLGGSFLMSVLACAACAATTTPPADPASSPATTAAAPTAAAAPSAAPMPSAPATPATPAPTSTAPSAAHSAPAMAPTPALPPHKADFTPPTTEADCKKCNGKWAKHGKAQITSCVCATSDGGKACRTSEDCDDTCELPLDSATKYEGVRCKGATCTGGAAGVVIPEGKCNAFRDHFGCRASIEVVKTDPSARYVRSICVD